MSARRTIVALAAALAGLAALPAVAHAAATAVSVNNADGSLDVFATAAEANNVTVSRDATHFIVSDAGPGVATADAGDCMPSGATIRCTASLVRSVFMALDNMTDRGEIDASVTDLTGSVVIEGGAGDDTLIGGPNTTNSLYGHEQFGNGPGVDMLTGGSLEDSLIGSDGNDTLIGGAGDNSLSPGLGEDTVIGGPDTDGIGGGATPDGPDSYSGGGGVDFISFGGRNEGVTVNTNNVADDGTGTEGDNVMDDIESAFMGRGNDTVIMGPGPNTVSGDEGNDFIDTGAGDDQVFGDTGGDMLLTGDGDDRVFPGFGPDTVDAGAGDDFLSGGEEGFLGGVAPDVFSGGPGTDLLTRGGSNLPLTLTLDGVPDDGVAGEGDNVMPDVEDAIGGNRNDTMGGNASDNQLIGGPGEDTLTGGPGADGLFGGVQGYEEGGGGGSEVVDGADSLSGGPGIDTLSGAGGADTLRSRDEGPDEIDCGSSTDTLFADSFDDPSADCDVVSRGVRIASKRASLANGKVSLSASCPQIEPGGCDASFKLRAGGKVIASANKVLDPGEKAKVKLKPTKAGRKALDGNGSLQATATATMTDSAGDIVSSERKVRVQL